MDEKESQLVEKFTSNLDSDVINEARTGYTFLCSPKQFLNIFLTNKVRITAKPHGFGSVDICVEDLKVKNMHETAAEYIEQKFPILKAKLEEKIPKNLKGDNVVGNSAESIKQMWDIYDSLGIKEDIPVILNSVESLDSLRLSKLKRKKSGGRLMSSRLHHNNAIVSNPVPDVNYSNPDTVVLSVTFFHPTTFIKSFSVLVASTITMEKLATIVPCNNCDLDRSVFIENILYTRSPRLTFDYVQKMMDVSLHDLPIRLGSHYRVTHGDCIHNFCFEQMRCAIVVFLIIMYRISHPSDPGLPFIIYRAKAKPKICSACEILLARRVSFNDDLCLESPCFLCEQCYVMLHSTRNGLDIRNHNFYFYEPDMN